MLTWVVVGLLLAAGVSPVLAGNPLSRPGAIQVPADARPLIDADLSQWILPTGRAAHVDTASGVLTVDQAIGWMVTRDRWSDFTLTFDFRVVGHSARASVLVRARGNAVDEPPPREGYSIVLADGTGRGGDLRSLPEQRERPLTRAAPEGARRATPLKGTFKPRSLGIDTWHTARLACAGGAIAVTLDGEPVVNAGPMPLRLGRLGLSVERGALEVRGMVVRGTPVSHGAYRPGNGIETPKLLRDVKPQYVAAAMQQKIQGGVWLEVLVLADGTVGEVTLLRSLDPTFGLDEAAIEAAWQWRFLPGRRAGQPVPVLVTIQMTFALK